MKRKRRLFVDTSYIYAVMNSSDSNHHKANDIENRGLDDSDIIYIGTNIISEIITIVSQRMGKSIAKELLGEIRSGSYCIVHVDEQLTEKAEHIFSSIESKNVSYADCVSFAIMNEFNLEWVLGFDKHFSNQGFKHFGIDK